MVNISSVADSASRSIYNARLRCFFGAAMAGEEDLCGADAIPLDGSPQRSRVAQALARWANFSYWLALALEHIPAGLNQGGFPNPGG
jgi:hypothetical protein